MSYGYRWKPNASQKAAYHQRMVAIETAKSTPAACVDELRNYPYPCTGDCCTGDEIAFFNAGKSAERLFGKIVSESYGADKQQHTFTIETEGFEGKILIKGRNLYANGVYRKEWTNEDERESVIKEKHERGEKARAARVQRKAEKYNGIYANGYIPDENDHAVARMQD